MLVQTRDGTSYEAGTTDFFILSRYTSVIKSIINVRLRTISSVGAGRLGTNDYATLGMTYWNSGTWTSLGTIAFDTNINSSGYVLVRRLY